MDQDQEVSSVLYAFQGTALFEGRDDWKRYDIEASVRKYAMLCQDALRNAYPEATIEIVDTEAGGGVTGFLETQVNGQVDPYATASIDEICEEIYSRFEWEVQRQWLRIPEAYRRFKVPHTTLLWACKAGLIDEAERVNDYWEFPLDTFVEFHDRNGTLTSCQEVISLRIAEQDCYEFQCLPERILDTCAVHFPADIDALLVVTPGNLGTLWFLNDDSSNLLVSRYADRINLLFEHFGNEIPWSSVWTYDTYAKAFVVQARKRSLDSEYDGATLVVRFTYDSSSSGESLRSLITQ